MKYKDGNVWKEINIKALDSMAIGSIILFAGNTIPTGWLLCRGQSLYISEYSELYAVIGITYGTGLFHNSTFSVPNLKGRVPVGLDTNDTDFDTLGETGGSKYLQEHTHNFTLIKSRSLPLTEGNPSGYNGDNTGVTTGSTSSAGTGDSGNLQPYIVLNYIIKAKDTTPVMASITDNYSTSTQDGYSCNYVNIELNKKQKLVNYSTNETDTGIKWEDNKTIYRKVVKTTTPSSTNSWVSIGSISNIDTLTDLRGFVIAGDGRKIPLNFSEPGAEISTTILNGNIEMKLSSDAWKDKYCYVIIEYTKSS